MLTLIGVDQYSSPEILTLELLCLKELGFLNAIKL